MARRRVISPEYCVDEGLADLPETDGLLFILVWLHADDAGRLVDSPRVIRGLCYPLRSDVTVDDVAQRLDRLVASRFLVRYEVNGQRLLQVRNWLKHQKINRPTPSVLPECPAKQFNESSLNPQCQEKRREEKLSKREVKSSQVKLREEEEKKAANASFSSLDMGDFKTRFPRVDVSQEVQDCAEWWRASGRQPKSAKLAFANWCKKAEGWHGRSTGPDPTGAAGNRGPYGAGDPSRYERLQHDDTVPQSRLP